MISIRHQHSTDNPSFAAALTYAQRRWPVLPCHGMQDGLCTCGGRPDCHPGKHPLTSHGFRDATTDPEQIERWWTNYPDANVAIATGPASGLIVLDEDPHHGGDFALEELEARYGKLPDTLVSYTGGGGRHYLFRHFGRPMSSRAHALGPGLDIRADGGFIVAPPSLHVSGHCYEWDAASDPADALIAPLPAWMWDLAGATTVQALSPMQTHPLVPLGGKSVPTYVGTCSLTGEEITGLFHHPDIALACARALGLPTGHIGKPFRCVLHDERHPSASLHWDPKTGALKYRDWHRKSGDEWYTLADVYASKTAGRVMRLTGPSMAVWFLRLLVEAEVCTPVAVPARRLSSTARPATRRVYEGFLFLLGCKWLHTPGDPTVFSWRFAEDWCGISERHAGESIRWLLQQDYIRQVGTYRRMALFLPVPPHDEAR